MIYPSELLKLSLLAQKMPVGEIEALYGEFNHYPDIDYHSGVIVLTEGDKTVDKITLKALQKELDALGLKRPLPIVPHPDKIIVSKIDIERKLKGSSLQLPKGSGSDDMLTEHVLQCHVVAIGKNVDKSFIRLGAKYYLTFSPQELIVYNQEVFDIAPMHLIGCLVFK